MSTVDDSGSFGDSPPTPLSRAVVLETALEIVDRDGVAGLSMRRLAGALDRDPMTLYRYAANKAALLDGVAELVLEQLVVDTNDDDWRSQLRERGAQPTGGIALAHPHVVPLLVTRPAGHPAWHLRPLRNAAPAGGHRWSCWPAQRVQRLSTRCTSTDSLFGFLHGHVLDELQELVDNPEETDDLLRLGLHRLPLQGVPAPARPGAQPWPTYDGAAELERGVDLLLSGLPLPPGGAVPDRRA